MILSVNIDLHSFSAIKCNPPEEVANTTHSGENQMYVYGNKIAYTCRVGYRYLFGKTIAEHRFSSALNVSTKSAICGLSNTSETEGVWLNVPKPCRCKYRLGYYKSYHNKYILG